MKTRHLDFSLIYIHPKGDSLGSADRQVANLGNALNDLPKENKSKIVKD